MDTAELFRKRPDRNYLYGETFQRKVTNVYGNSENEENLLDFINFRTEHETYYDCSACEHDETGILQQQCQIFEVINAISNPRQFRSLLSQMAYTSNVLYRAFSQAYSKAKKHKQKNTKRNFMTSDKTNPCVVIKVEVPPTSKLEHLEDVRCEPLATGKQASKCLKKHKYFSRSFKDEDEQGICPIEDQCGKKPLETEKETEKKEDQKPAELTEKNICQDFVDKLLKLRFFEKCACLRAGETVLPNAQEEEVKPQRIENITDTSHDENNTKTLYNQTQTPAKQVLNLSPICVNIPLKLQIDGEHGQSRSIETEIQMITGPANPSEPKNTTRTHTNSASPGVLVSK